MRLTDAEKISNYIKSEINPYGKPFKGNAYEFGIKLIKYLENASVDYDVDKVVERLENERKFWENAYDSNLGKEKARSYEHAIEIVKSGGIDGR